MAGKKLTTAGGKPFHTVTQKGQKHPVDKHPKMRELLDRLRQYAKPIGIVSATCVFLLSLAKENVDDSRREVDRIESTRNAHEQGQQALDAFKLTNDFELAKRVPIENPKEEIDRIVLLNLYNHSLVQQLNSLRDLSVLAKEPLETSTIDKLLKVLEETQPHYQEILALVGGERSKFLKDPMVAAKFESMTNSFMTMSEEARGGTDDVRGYLLSETKDAFTKANTKLMLWKNVGRVLLVFGYAVNVFCLLIGVKPAEGPE
jgi:hypothetical protein